MAGTLASWLRLIEQRSVLCKKKKKVLERIALTSVMSVRWSHPARCVESFTGLLRDYLDHLLLCSVWWWDACTVIGQWNINTMVFMWSLWFLFKRKMRRNPNEMTCSYSPPLKLRQAQKMNIAYITNVFWMLCWEHGLIAFLPKPEEALRTKIWFVFNMILTKSTPFERGVY